MVQTVASSPLHEFARSTFSSSYPLSATNWRHKRIDKHIQVLLSFRVSSYLSNRASELLCLLLKLVLQALIYPKLEHKINKPPPILLMSVPLFQALQYMIPHIHFVPRGQPIKKANDRIGHF